MQRRFAFSIARFEVSAARFASSFALCTLLLAATSPVGRAQIWTVGLNDGGWPAGDGGGANASFVQENGAVNALPGSPDSTEVPLGADNDYYFAGEYSTVLAGNTANGVYDPVGTVAVNEEAAERAFAGGDLDLRYHFNLPNTLVPTDLLSITFEPFNLDTGNIADPRFGVEVYFNGVLVQDQIVVRPVQLGKSYTTPQFTLASVDGQVGPGIDNIVSLKGISYNGEGGGNWMGIDYIQLNSPAPPIPSAVFPWNVGRNDNLHAVGDGGGPNATFVQENGAINPLPGNPASPEVNQQADNDYYFAGSYTTAIAGNGAYAPVGLVPVNEEAAERAFAGADNDLRYHFNLPNAVTPNDLVSVSFDALSLHTDPANTDPRYGVAIYVNGVLVQPEIIIRPAQLGRTFTTAPFRMSFVNAEVGPGFDNIVTLRGINKSAEGGGNWMGIDYVELAPATAVIPPGVVPWTVGLDDNLHPIGDGGGANATFVQENGAINALPGNPANPETNGQADNDYYFAGSYTSVITGNGVYAPVGLVAVNEEAAERAFAGADNDLRYHFNLPSSLNPNDLLSVTFDALSLDTGAPATDPRYGVEVYVNNVLVQPQIVVRPPDITANTDFTTPQFTLASVNAQVGPGFDNIVSLRGTNFNAQGGGNWMGIDYVQLNPHPRVSFPWAVGQDDNEWPFLNGGGPNASFVQENGAINPLPGNPANPELAQQGDNDYYFAGIYTTPIDSVIASYGDYTPVGLVLSNEETAERAFAAADLDLRYHFNLPSTLTPTDMVTVAFDAFNLHIDPALNSDPRHGIEVYFNGVLVQPEILIRPPDLGKYHAIPPFSLGSVNARFGPGADNIVSLKGINYNNDGGGNWMGIDYVQLNPITSAGFPLAVGLDDDAQPAGNGGGPNATFVQENGAINALPGSPASAEINQRADNDYYFAGLYTTVIPSNGVYDPVGLVGVNEEAAERAFAGNDNDLRYHFNLPNTLQPTDKLTVTFDVFNLHTDPAVASDPRYGIEVYFNSVLVRPETIIRPADIDTNITTPEFTLASVNAQVGPGADNIVSLKGINYNADGGGNWMGMDAVQINGTVTAPLAFLPTVVANGQVTLNWTGTGLLEWSSTLVPPWTPITPAPTPPYTEPIAPGGLRFYRLRRP